ncbi:hypothetical protein [Helicobacter sp. T3_23-1059]
MSLGLDFWRWFYFPLPCGGARGWVSCHCERIFYKIRVAIYC